LTGKTLFLAVIPVFSNGYFIDISEVIEQGVKIWPSFGTQGWEFIRFEKPEKRRVVKRWKILYLSKPLPYVVQNCGFDHHS
jgi:hypothetical protein